MTVKNIFVGGEFKKGNKDKIESYIQSRYVQVVRWIVQKFNAFKAHK